MLLKVKTVFLISEKIDLAVLHCCNCDCKFFMNLVFFARSGLQIFLFCLQKIYSPNNDSVSVPQCLLKHFSTVNGLYERKGLHHMNRMQNIKLKQEHRINSTSLPQILSVVSKNSLKRCMKYLTHSTNASIVAAWKQCYKHYKCTCVFIFAWQLQILITKTWWLLRKWHTNCNVTLPGSMLFEQLYTA